MNGGAIWIGLLEETPPKLLGVVSVREVVVEGFRNLA